MNTESGSVGLTETKTLTLPEPFTTESGKTLSGVRVAYETYGELNNAGDNAILVIHALTGDAHAAGFHSADAPRPGWWDPIIGPGKALDTDRYFVVCTNNLGGCSGTTGPTSVNPETGRPYGTSFPVVTVEDTVRLQREFLDAIGVKRLRSVIGGSMAGMQTLEWGLRYNDFCDSVIPVAGAARLTPMGIAWDKIARSAIMADAGWDGGGYESGTGPKKGLGVARMIAHITYLSGPIMWEKFGRRVRDKGRLLEEITARFEVESYLDHQGGKFVDRFDANAYLYLSRMMDLYDASSGYADLKAALERLRTKCLLVCFISDWLFPPHGSIEIAEALQSLGREVELHNVESTYGHDAFLVQIAQLTRIVGDFLSRLEEGGPIGLDAMAVPADTRRFVLTFPAVEVRKPVLWELGKKFGFAVNIIRGDVSNDSGWQVCEFEGGSGEIAEAVSYLRSRGIWVDPGGDAPIDHDRAEVV
ncbi:MAG: homoserine O-acetyltransferase [Nitrospinota bacterium]|nr:homoserine O-acetyltransferase [Nitrospinota bacterium]